MLKEHPDVAVIFLDVVMESEDAGLKLAHYIRHELNNRLVVLYYVRGIRDKRQVKVSLWIMRLMIIRKRPSLRHKSYIPV